MDTTIEVIEGTLLDPVVLTSTAAVSFALLSGAAARAIDIAERRPARSRRGAGSTRTS